MSHSRKHIIFIAPTSSQPRYHKRVRQLAKFARVTIFAFKRQLYNENTFDKDFIYYSLGEISDGNYRQRLFKIAKAIYTIRNFVKRVGGEVEYYAMSMDCLFIARMAGIKQGYYEVGDLRTVDGSHRLFTVLERRFFSDIKGLVLTSRFFYEEFYKKYHGVPEHKVHVIDNKLNPIFAGQRSSFPISTEWPIRIGLIGLFRYDKPIEYLLRYASQNPDKMIVECHGDGPSVDIVRRYLGETIRYYGSFKNPDDLEKIYTSVDLNFVVYDVSSENVRLAIPNKLFESAFFGRPLLAAQGTALAKMAMDWGIGKEIRLSSYEAFAEDMAALSIEWLQKAHENCEQIDEKELLDDGEKVLEKMLS